MIVLSKGKEDPVEVNFSREGEDQRDILKRYSAEAMGRYSHIEIYDQSINGPLEKRLVYQGGL